jgi:hypothetical protein
MSRYLILGAGKFGRLALERLARQENEASFLMVDTSQEALAEARALIDHNRVRVIQGEAVAFLLKFLKDTPPWEWTIPMVPVHVAFQWLWQGPLAGLGWQKAEVPAALEKLAHATRGAHGELYLSRAAHLCPDDCAEPDTCPVTGESREIPLYMELASLKIPDYQIMVLPSRQLAPGVGGYPASWPLALAQELAALEKGKVLIATACRCHGVVNAIERWPWRAF